jgi:hypothetical protein
VPRQSERAKGQRCGLALAQVRIHTSQQINGAANPVAPKLFAAHRSHDSQSMCTTHTNLPGSYSQCSRGTHFP